MSSRLVALGPPALFGALALVFGCEHAEFSLPSGHPEGEPPAPTPMDPAKVPASVAFFRAPTEGGRSLFVPFACFDRTHHVILAGEACSERVALPPGAPLNCVGGGSAPAGARSRVACGGEGTTTWPAVEAAGLRCDLATWGDAPPLPEVIELPAIEPQVTAEERAALERAAPGAPLELKQAITLDLDHDGAKERVFTTRGAMFVTAGKHAEGAAAAPRVALRAPGEPIRVVAVTDLDHDLVPELWVLRGAGSLELGVGAGGEIALERLAPEGTSQRVGAFACAAPATPAPSAPPPPP